MKQFPKSKLAIILASALITAAAVAFFVAIPGPPSADASIKGLMSQEITTLLDKMNMITVTDNTAVPDFELLDLDGKTVHLSDFKGDTVLLGFFTTW